MEKLKEKPPVLSEKQLNKATSPYITSDRFGLRTKMMEAQRDADMIWFQDWLKKNNYVQLDPDQSLPEKEFMSSNENYRYAEAQQDMLNKGFKKVL